MGFLNDVKDRDVLASLADNIRNAMMDYQVCPQSSFFDQT